MHCHLQPWLEFGIMKVLLTITGFFFWVVFLFQSLLLSLKFLEDTKKTGKIILLIWNYHFIDYVIVFTGVRCY